MIGFDNPSMATILIVEDDRASARLLSLLLKKGGHEVTAAHTLEVAKKWLFEYPEFDLMILDNRLGDNYGWELLEELRGHFYFRDLPVIVYTAAGDRDSISKYVELKVQNIRTKPYAWGVLALEIDRALKTQWHAADFVPTDQILERLQLTAPDYYKSLRELGTKLTKSADALLEMLTPSKERPFLNVLNELRSQSVNLGVAVVQRVIKESVESFKAGDWSRAVRSVRTFNIVAKRIDQRVKIFEAEKGELDDDASDDFFFAEPEDAVAAASAANTGKLSQILAGEVPPIFRRMAASFAQGDTVEMLIRKAVRGVIPPGRYGDCLESLGKKLHWVAFLEPSDLEAVAEAVRRVEGLEDRLRALPSKRSLEGESLRDLIAEFGVFQVGLIAATLELRAELRDRNLPVRLDYLVVRQLLNAMLVRKIAARIQRPINLEAVVWLQFLGEWVFALRFPGVYAMALLEATDNPVHRHAASFVPGRNALVAKLSLPAFCRESLHSGDLETFTGQGAARLSLGLSSLASSLSEAFHLDAQGQPLDEAREQFAKSPAWELLASESLKLPADRNRFFDALARTMAGCYESIEILLATGSTPAPAGSDESVKATS